MKVSGRKRNPLERGYSRKTISANVAKMMREGRSPAQGVAAALLVARGEFRRRHPGKALPSYLRPGRRRKTTARPTRSATKRNTLAKAKMQTARIKLYAHPAMVRANPKPKRRPVAKKRQAPRMTQVLVSGKVWSEFASRKAAIEYGQALADATGRTIEIR